MEPVPSTVELKSPVWWTPAQLAARWQFSKSKVVRLLESRAVLGKKVGSQWRVHHDAVLLWESDGMPLPSSQKKPDLSAFEVCTDWLS